MIFPSTDAEPLRSSSRSRDKIMRMLRVGFCMKSGVPVARATTTFSNVSPDSFFDVFFEVAELAGGNQILNAEGGPGGVGSKVSV